MRFDMMLKLALSVLVVCAIGCHPKAHAPPIARDQRDKPMLKCAMRWIGGKMTATVGGKPMSWETPDAAEVTITNISNANVDIRSPLGWVAHLDLRVKDPNGANAKTEPLNSYLSTKSFDPKPDILKPGEVRLTDLVLLGSVPEEERIPGTYRVQAVFTIDNKECTSDWVEIKWPWEKKGPETGRDPKQGRRDPKQGRGPETGDPKQGRS
jgi:hypothetical protein